MSGNDLSVGGVMLDLDQLSRDLDQYSRDLADVERKLEPVAKEHDDFVDSFVAGLWEKHVGGDHKWPGEDVRLALARQAMDTELLGRYSALMNSRRRLEKRISSMKPSIEAKRSILSALKLEMEAVS